MCYALTREYFFLKRIQKKQTQRNNEKKLNAFLSTCRTKQKDTMDQEVVKKEAHARAMFQKMSADPENQQQRLWRWALRGIVIQ